MTDAVKEETESIQKIKIDQIDVDGENHRRRDLDVANLAESIKSAGLRQPVCVFKDGRRYRLVYGFRRLEACKSLGWDVVRAEVIDKIEGEDLHQFRAAENLDRKDLTPVEEAVAVTRIYTEIMSDGDPTRDHAISKVGKKLGKTEAWVRDRVYLLERCTKKVVQMALDDPRITVGHLRELAKVGDDRQQEKLCSQIVHTKKDWRNQKHIESVEVESIESLREQIDRLERSLDRVPWVLSLPIGKLPACMGCPSNTATDETLFGKEHKGEDVGFCMNAACYQKKHAAAERADKNVAAKIERMKKKDASIDMIRRKSPMWAKPERIQRYVKKNVKGCAPKPEKKKASKKLLDAKAEASNQSKSSVDAIKKYKVDYTNWAKACRKALGDKVRENPLACLLLEISRELDLGDEYDFNWSGWFHPVNKTYDFKTKKYAYSIRSEPKPASPKFEATLKRIMDTKIEDFQKIADLAIKHGHGNYGEYFDVNDPPDVLIRAAKTLGVEIPERPAVPDVKKKKAKKKKAKAKKKAKKKAAKVKPSKKRPAKKK